MAMSRSRGRTSFTSLPSISIVPFSMSSSPAMVLSRVDLPQPEGPTSTVNSPDETWRLTPRSTSTGPKRLCSPRITTSAMTGSSRDGAHGDAAHQETLHGRYHNEDRHGPEHRHGSDLGPEIRLAAEIMRDLDRIGGDLGPGQHQGEDKVVPGEDESEDRGGEQAGPTHRAPHCPHPLPAGAAISQGALLELERHLLDIAPHHPDDIGQAEGRIEDDQPVIGIDPGKPDIEQEDREDDSDRRHQTLRDDPDGEVLAAGLEAGETVGAHGSEHHGKEGADACQHQAVPDREGIAVLEQHMIIGELNALRIPDRRVMKDLLRRLEGDDEEPVDREDEEQRQRDHGGIAPRKSEPTCDHLASPRRRMAQVTTTDIRATIRKAMAAL